MKRIAAFLAQGCVLIAITISIGNATPQELWVGKFSSGNKQEVFENWQPYQFPSIESHSQYRLIQEQGTWVIQATSEASASGLIRAVDIDLKQYPIISWSWKVTQRPAGKDDSDRKDDDHAARIYLIFNPPKTGESKVKQLWRQLLASPEKKTHALSYIWAHSADLDKPIPNPYSDSAMMIPVNRGDQMMNTWVEIERNLLQDYQNSFGRLPPKLSAIALMTDTDNSQSKATAYYGDIKFSNGNK